MRVLIKTFGQIVQKLEEREMAKSESSQLSLAEDLAIKINWAISRYKISRMIDEAYKDGAEPDKKKMLLHDVFTESNKALIYELAIRNKRV